MSISKWLYPTVLVDEDPYLIEEELHVDHLRHVDMIGSLVGIATLTLIEKSKVQGSKMVLESGRFLPKTPTDSASGFKIAKFINPEGMANTLLSGFQAIDRTCNNSGRIELLFFNRAIPFVHHLYPANSVEKQAIIKRLWMRVLNGINILEPSYPEGAKFDHSKKLKRETRQLELTFKNSLSKTFSCWKKTITEYIKEPMIEKTTSNQESQSKQQVSEQVAQGLQTANEKQSVPNVENFEVKETEGFSEILAKCQLLINEALAKDKLGIGKDLAKVLELAIKSSTEPVVSFSEALKKVWSYEEINKILNEMDAIEKSTSELDRRALMEKLQKKLEHKAKEYTNLVEKTLEKAMLN